MVGWIACACASMVDGEKGGWVVYSFFFARVGVMDGELLKGS